MNQMKLKDHMKIKTASFQSSLLGISTLMSTLSNPSTIDTSASVDSTPKPLPRSQQTAKSKLPIQATPPLQDNNQLSLSFRNFVEEEMISYIRNEMHNQFLSDKISNEYYG